MKNVILLTLIIAMISCEKNNDVTPSIIINDGEKTIQTTDTLVIPNNNSINLFVTSNYGSEKNLETVISIGSDNSLLSSVSTYLNGRTEGEYYEDRISIEITNDSLSDMGETSKVIVFQQFSNPVVSKSFFVKFE